MPFKGYRPSVRATAKQPTSHATNESLDTAILEAMDSKAKLPKYTQAIRRQSVPK